VWSERFEHPLADAAHAQDRIAISVAERVRDLLSATA